MLVGEVRCATTGFGSSWKLSGGSAWSSGATNVSKKRQVRARDAHGVGARRSGERVGRRRGSGRLTQRHERATAATAR